MLKKFFQRNTSKIIIDDIEPSVCIHIDLDLAQHLQVGDELVVKEEFVGVSKWIKSISKSHNDYDELTIKLTSKYISSSFYDFFAESTYFKYNK